MRFCLLKKILWVAEREFPITNTQKNFGEWIIKIGTFQKAKGPTLNPFNVKSLWRDSGESSEVNSPCCPYRGHRFSSHPHGSSLPPGTHVHAVKTYINIKIK